MTGCSYLNSIECTAKKHNDRQNALENESIPPEILSGIVSI